MPFMITILGLLVLATPVLALIAFIRVQSLTERLNGLPLKQLAERLAALERQLDALERRVSSATVTAPAPPPLAAQPVIAPQPVAPTQVPAPHPPVPSAPVTPAPSAAHPPSEAGKPSQQLPVPPKPREVAASSPHASVFAAPPLHASQAKSSSSLDWETIIGGRWLNRVGIIAVILAMTFFLKYAFDNNWIGPSGRVGIGVLLGAAMVPWSLWLLRRGYLYFAEGIAGLGAAVMYTSIWAGCQYYALFSRDVGFYGMIAVTAGMAAFALGINSQRVALLSLLGGFLTPILVSSGKDEEVALFVYLLSLGTGLLIIELLRDWRSLTPVSFFFSQIYFWGWYARFYNHYRLEGTLLFATLFFVLYLALPVLRAVRFEKFNELDVLLSIINGSMYFVALFAMLWPKDRWPLTLLALGLSAVYLVVARMVPEQKPNQIPLARMIFAGMALTFATLAIPVRLDGTWLTMAFSVEGAILVWTGARSKLSLLKVAGFLLLAIGAIRLLLIPIPAPQFLWNARFAAYAVFVGSLAAILYAASRDDWSIERDELPAYGFCAVFMNIFALIALSLELWDYFGHRMGIDSGLAQHLSLSLLWTAYASALITLGIQRKSALLRWQALALFGMVVVKVFIYDSSFLDRFYRILSFLILGVVLLVVSFLYQRKLARGRTAS
jgi:uncharacterized membrane protein